MKRYLIVLSCLNSLLRKHRTSILLAAVASMAAGLCSSGLLALVNLHIKGGQAPFLPIPVLFVLAVITYLGTSFWAEYLHIRIAEGELANLRYQLGKQILDLPLRRMEVIGSGNLFASLTNDLDRIIQLLFKIPNFILNLSTAVGCCVYLVYVSPAVAGFTVLYLAFCFAAYMLPFQLAEKYVVRVRELWDGLCHAFHSITHGTKELLMHGERRKHFLEDRIRGTAEEIRSERIKGRAIQNFCYRWGDCLYFIGLGGLLFLLTPWLGLDSKSLVTVIWILLYMIIPIHFVIDWGPDLQAISVAIQKLQSIGFSFDYDREDSRKADGAEKLAEKQQAPLLELRELRFKYFNREEDETFAIGPITLSIEQNTVVFLTGGNGSGKTTLMKTLCGLYPPEAGEILWKGELIDDANRHLYRQMFSVVFSDFYLFDELFGLDRGLVAERAEHYLERLNLRRKVNLNEARLSTTDLSQGQRKRLALLTAYLEDRPFYIFDEWASDQDPMFKRAFYHEILPDLKARGKTVLVISHDSAFYDVADRVLQLEDGHLKEGGPR